MKRTVFLNNEFLPGNEAKISPDDRGFIFADGVYEVTKYYNGVPFRLGDHLHRLQHSLNELGIQLPENIVPRELFYQLLEKNKLLNTQAGVYIQISRGAHKRIHNFPSGIEPTVYAFAFELPSFKENLEGGIKVITHEDIRWQRCDIKSVSLLPNTMLYNKAVEAGAGECVMLRDGKVTEATHSSVLGVKDGVLITRPLSNFILPGITRKVILEICQNNGIPMEERCISELELYELDELIIAGTGSEVTPAIQINDRLVGDGVPGEVTRNLQKEFFKLTSKQ